MKLRVGAIVEDISPYFHLGMTGRVIWINSFNPLNPISEHGMIEIKVLTVGNSTYLEVGDLEHYCHSNWDQFLKVIG